MNIDPFSLNMILVFSFVLIMIIGLNIFFSSLVDRKHHPKAA